MNPPKPIGDKPTELSSCHQAPVKLIGGRGDFSDREEGITMHYVCTECGNACDLYADTPITDLSNTYPTDNPPQGSNKKAPTQKDGAGNTSIASQRGDELREKIEKMLDDFTLEYLNYLEQFPGVSGEADKAEIKLKDLYVKELVQLIHEHTVQAVKHRFCATCYRPCGTGGGYWGTCPEHGGLSQDQTLYMTIDEIKRINSNPANGGGGK